MMKDRHFFRRGTALAVIAAGSLWAAMSEAAHADQVLGVLDARSGILTPSSSQGTTAPISATGTVSVVAAFTFGTEIAAGDLPFSSITAGLKDATYTNLSSIQTTANRSGETGSTTLTIPYYWTTTAAGETVSVNLYSSVTAASGTRYTCSQILTFPLPASGKVTSYSIPIGF